MGAGELCSVAFGLDPVEAVRSGGCVDNSQAAGLHKEAAQTVDESHRSLGAMEAGHDDDKRDYDGRHEVCRHSESERHPVQSVLPE
jgi:hypothetical protein